MFQCRAPNSRSIFSFLASPPNLSSLDYRKQKTEQSALRLQTWHLWCSMYSALLFTPATHAGMHTHTPSAAGLKAAHLLWYMDRKRPVFSQAAARCQLTFLGLFAGLACRGKWDGKRKGECKSEWKWGKTVPPLFKLGWLECSFTLPLS